MALATAARPGDTDALDALIDAEEATLRARTRRSHQLHATAAAHLPGGVASSWQDAPPCPIFVARGRGSRVWDVDGNEYVDLHNGFGVMVAGHAHPAIVAAVRDRVAAGTHFAQPVPDIIPVAEELARRFGLPAVALRQLRDRGDAGRRPSDARRHRAAPADQGRGQLPRAPRRAPGLGVPRARRGRPRRPAARGARALGGVAGAGRPHPRGPVRPPRRRPPCPPRPSRRDRRDDHRAGDDEHRRDPATAGVPGLARRPAPRPRRPAHLRRGQDRAHHRAGRCHRALRRRARHRLPRQGARWWRAVRGDRRDRRR